MTTVAIWISREQENYPKLWVVTDSLLSNTYPQTTLKLIECGAKLFSILVRCRKPTSFRDNIRDNSYYFSTTIGMAFAGSSTFPLNLYAYISHSLRDLDSSKNAIPSIEDLAEHACKVFERIMNNYYSYNKINEPTTPSPCEVSIFGYCSKTEKYRVFHIYHIKKEAKAIYEEIGDIYETDYVFMMGNHKDEIKFLIKEQRANNNEIMRIRAPLLVVQNIINEKKYDTIGGWVQLGICNSKGFQLYVPYKKDYEKDYKCHPSYQNIALDCREPIGECFFTPFGMS